MHGRVGPTSAGAPPNLPPTRSIPPRATLKPAGAVKPGRAEWTTPPHCPRRPRYCSRAAPAPRAFPGGGHGRGKAAAARTTAPAHSPGSAANSNLEARSGERRRPAVAAAATLLAAPRFGHNVRPRPLR